jgi:hypothetical protein
VSQEAAEAAAAASAAAQEVTEQVRVAEAQASGNAPIGGPRSLPAPEPVSAADLLGDDHADARVPDRA